jgi:hypothetical protein
MAVGREEDEERGEEEKRRVWDTRRESTKRTKVAEEDFFKSIVCYIRTQRSEQRQLWYYYVSIHLIACCVCSAMISRPHKAK